jgi:hypothetical protein
MTIVVEMLGLKPDPLAGETVIITDAGGGLIMKLRVKIRSFRLNRPAMQTMQIELATACYLGFGG